MEAIWLRNENDFGTLNKDTAYMRNIPFSPEILLRQQLFPNKKKKKKRPIGLGTLVVRSVNYALKR